MGLDANQREALLNDAQNNQHDVIIVGGGITGAGILREASLRGLSAILIEAEDFASGTSSKSTKLIHGGLRYLAMGHVHVVREAARERKRVHRLAPHLAEPRWLMLPASNRFELAKYVVGVTAYEKLGQVEKADKHFNLSGPDLEEFEPLLNRKRFPHACVYREYLTDDARLVLANVRGGIQAGGAAINKLKVTGLHKENDKVQGVITKCQLSGESIVIRGRTVINAAGPWVEHICQLDGLPMPKSMVLSKGIHIVVPASKLPVKQMTFSISLDDRPVFVVPKGETVYLGTTDSLYDKAEVWPEVTADEVDYLFEPIRRYYDVELNRDDCLTSWAGLRPLIFESGKSTKEISRKDEVWLSESGLITIAGGKLTGYRKMAEDAVNKACDVLGLSMPALSSDEALPGGDISTSLRQSALDLAQVYPMADTHSDRLVKLYGDEGRKVLAMGKQALIPDGSVFSGEVHWAIREKGAHSLEDVLYRRTRAALYAPAETSDLVAPIANLMADELGWSESKLAAEIAHVNQLLAADIAFRRTNSAS
jgi:glycerol-3-phosphate dehydrogenase